MPSAANPGILGYIIFLLGVVAIVLLGTGLGTNHWIFIPGTASVEKTDQKLQSKSSMTLKQLETNWPNFQANYNQMRMQLFTLMSMPPATAAPASANSTPAPNPIMALQVGIGKLVGLNATRNAIEPMKKLDQHAGFYKMCVFHFITNEWECNGPTEYVLANNDRCDPDYVNPNPTLPTTNAILLKTFECNADGLSQAVTGSQGFFGGVLIAALVISVIPLALILFMTIKPEARGQPFNGIVVGALLIFVGALVIGFTAFYSAKIIGNYLDSGMKGTRTGFSWILSLISGILFIVAGLPGFLLRKEAEISPA